jgi:hypothetical protein
MCTIEFRLSMELLYDAMAGGAGVARPARSSFIFQEQKVGVHLNIP